MRNNNTNHEGHETMSEVKNLEIETTITATNKRCIVEHREVTIIIAAGQGFESDKDMAVFQRNFYGVMSAAVSYYATKGKALNAAIAIARGENYMHRDGLVVVQLSEGRWWVGGVNQQLLNTLNS